MKQYKRCIAFYSSRHCRTPSICSNARAQSFFSSSSDGGSGKFHLTVCFSPLIMGFSPSKDVYTLKEEKRLGVFFKGVPILVFPVLFCRQSRERVLRYSLYMGGARPKPKYLFWRFMSNRILKISSKFNN